MISNLIKTQAQLLESLKPKMLETTLSNLLYVNWGFLSEFLKNEGISKSKF